MAHIPFPYLAELPLYARWNTALLAGSVLLCSAVVLVGIGMEGWRARRDGAAQPGSYPTVWDNIFSLIILLFLLSSGMGGGSEPQNAPQDTGFSPGSALMYVGVFLPMVVRYALVPAPQGRAGWRYCLAWALLAVVAAHLFAFLYEQSGLFELITQSSGSPKLQSAVRLIREGDPISRWLAIGTAVIAAPVCEECCFRGIIYRVLKKHAGTAVGIALSSLLFAAIHCALGQALPLVVFAVLLCLLYERTRTLRSCIIAHMAFNLISVLSALLLTDL